MLKEQINSLRHSLSDHKMCFPQSSRILYRNSSVLALRSIMATSNPQSPTGLRLAQIISVAM